MSQETKEPSNTAASGCRCDGTGFYAAEISVADAVVLVHRVCLDHLAPRARVRDTTTGRTGEVMEVNKAYENVYLRPVGGGREWKADAGSLEPVEPQ